MSRTAVNRWHNCCAAFNWRDVTRDSWHQKLIDAYSEPQRSYHTIQHLDECLRLLDEVSCNQPNMIEMALWFHDAVYDPKALDNEERSAVLASEALEAAGVAPALVAEVRRMIMLTKTHQPGRGPDDATLIDIDLAILGQEAVRFGEYEQQIRREYAWVPDEVYRVKRAEILRGFLQRDPIYRSPFFHQKFESAARSNLRRLISQLQ